MRAQVLGGEPKVRSWGLGVRWGLEIGKGEGGGGMGEGDVRAFRGGRKARGAGG